jgi:SAM-dependent methyltransferase
MTKKEQPNTVSSVQKKPDSIDDLRKSYDELYDHGWLGEHHNNEQQKLLLDSADVGPGLHLDVACGMGYSLDFAIERGAYSVGIELSSTAIKRGKRENHRRLMVQGNGELLPWENDIFDYVTCLGSLEHFVNPSKGASEISRVLKPEGTAAILLPNSHNLLAIYNVYKTGGILPEQQEYERFATRVEWENLLNNSGLKVVDVKKFNVGFARVFKKGRGLFWYLYNAIYRVFGDFWIPVNLSYNLIFVCKKI